MSDRSAHCGWCGAAFTMATWPRTCAACGNTSYANPVPVAVVLLPVDKGLLVIRRGIEPQRGRLALPGGFMELHESWQESGARELREETGIDVAPASLQVFDVQSTGHGQLIVLALAPALRSVDLPAFVATEEATEAVVLTAPAELAFGLHTSAVATWFKHRGT